MHMQDPHAMFAASSEYTRPPLPTVPMSWAAPSTGLERSEEERIVKQTIQVRTNNKEEAHSH